MAEITVPARVDLLADILGFVENAARDAELDVKQKNIINIAVEEIFVNIAQYAYPSGEGYISVSVSLDADKFVIEFRDSGTPYNPLAKPDPDTSMPTEKREPGGLGIYMVKKLTDDVSYEYRDRQNVLTIVIKRP
jgi:anti-sigma regulatory factor (Ser/Thr protein kinase)